MFKGITIHKTIFVLQFLQTCCAVYDGVVSLGGAGESAGARSF